MSSGPEEPGRAELLAALAAVGRDHSDATVSWHTSIADTVGIHPTDYKVMRLLQRSGPLTAGAIAETTGLTTASVTALIDRLGRRGFVARLRDPADGRRVIVEATPDGIAAFAPFYASPEMSQDRLYAPYDEEQLALIADFLRRSAARLRDATQRLNDTRATRPTSPRGPAANA
jgi:DNA-binding MarR family transcriptional regulator